MVPFTSKTLVTAQEICIRMDPLPVPHGNGVDSAVSTSPGRLLSGVLARKQREMLSSVLSYLRRVPHSHR